MDGEYALIKYRNRGYKKDEVEGSSLRIGLLDSIGIVLFFFWIFWAFQCCPKPDPEFQTKYAQNRTNRVAMSTFLGQFADRAQKLGRNYGPRELYEDMRRIDRKDMQLHYPYIESNSVPVSSGTRSYLSDLSAKNVRLGNKLAITDMQERVSYDGWKAKNDIGPKTLVAEFGPRIKKWRWHHIISWCSVFYVRTAFLCMLSFLISILRRRKRILATILADKRAFVQAVLVWPIGIFTYPSNRIREIVVETELRRLKTQLLQPLGFLERLKVEQIANSSGYKTWRIDYHRLQSHRFRRSFLLALLGTIICMIQSPLMISANQVPANKEKTKAAMTCHIRGGPIFQVQSEQIKKLSINNFQAPTQDTWLGPLTRNIDSRLTFVWKLWECNIIKLPGLIGKIRHVPLNDYLVYQIIDTI